MVSVTRDIQRNCCNGCEVREIASNWEQAVKSRGAVSNWDFKWLVWFDCLEFVEKRHWKQNPWPNDCILPIVTSRANSQIKRQELYLLIFIFTFYSLLFQSSSVFWHLYTLTNASNHTTAVKMQKSSISLSQFVSHCHCAVNSSLTLVSSNHWLVFCSYDAAFSRISDKSWRTSFFLS
jgi:hypothetical protein